MLMNFTPNMSIEEAIASGDRSAGTSDINGETVDFQGWLGSVVAVVEFGTIAATAVTSLKWQGSDNGTAWKDLVGTEVAVPANDDDEYYVVELHFPRHRYNRIVVERGTANAAVRSAQYILCGPRKAVTSFPNDYHVYFNVSPDYVE